VVVLSDNVESMMLCLAILIQIISVTDIQTGTLGCG